MSTTHTGVSRSGKFLRLWPGIVVAVLVVLLRYVVPIVAPHATIYGIIASVAGAAVVLLWWLFLSRAPWLERVGAIVVALAAYFAVRPFLHASIAGGMMGMLFPVYAIPSVLVPAFVAWAVVTRKLPDGVRRATMVVTIVLSCAVWTLARTDGVIGEGTSQLRWRWTPTAEERLLARGDDAPKAAAPAAPPAAAPAPTTSTEPRTGEAPPAAKEGEKPVEAKRAEPAPAPATKPSVDKALEASASGAAERAIRRVEWPGFRGPERDSVLHGFQIATDWSASPPVEVWRRPIGPGWSSFAVDGDRFYTQEQRGEEEIVSCYRLRSGEPVWRHRDAARFYESNGGPGPRATPTLHTGRVYTLGATGILNALDAATGAVIWSRNAQADSGAPLPPWGFAGSPLVVDNVLVVATSGRLAGYDLASGKLRWTRMTGGGGYSSPHLVTMDGVAQVVLMHGAGVTSVAPADGTVLWSHAWNYGTAIVQPAVLVNNGMLAALGDAMGGSGIRRLAVSRTGSTWNAEERWTSRGLKPYFNDYVVHEGHVYGFDGSILSCINLEDGERKWKGGRYGQGQLLLLPDQDLLLLLSEEGELALVRATPDKFTEVAPKFKAIEGKTWNHPVLVGDLLLVRNGEEMAAFRLPRAAD